MHSHLTPPLHPPASWLPLALLVGLSLLAGCASVNHAVPAAPAGSVAQAFTFPADAQWHATPWFAHAGERWQLRQSAGDTSSTTAVVWLRIGERVWPLIDPRSLDVDGRAIVPGAISLRTDREWPHPRRTSVTVHASRDALAGTP